MPSEFAPGIPASRTIQELPKIEKPRTFEFGIHHHFSEGAAKEHFDLRLGDPSTGHAHSWALKYLPKPGETRLAVQQPTHTVNYMDFHGRIESGYGKGKVDLLERDKAEVLSSSSGHVRFNVYKGKEIREYLLRRPEPETKKWIIQNITPTRQSGIGQLLPSHKPKYKTTSPEKIDVDNQETELQAKIDGAHTLVQFGATGRTPRIYSYRSRKGEVGSAINHTPKFPDFNTRKTPGGLKDTIVRTETYAVSPTGTVLPAARIGGILNANVWQSREKQKAEGKLESAVIDVERFKGKDVSNLPWREKKPILQRVVELAPWLKLPRSASSPKEKKQLLSDIARGKEPTTHEGVIEWHPDSAVPKKAKFLEERDVYVKGVFAEAGVKRQGTLAGGFEISTTPHGPVIGRVGTGFSHAMKKDMLDNSEAYRGLKMRVLTERAPQHYAPRAPRFLSFHLDQDLSEGIKTASDGTKVNIEPHPEGMGVVIKALHIPKGARGQGKARAIIRSIKAAYPHDQIWIRPRPYGDMPVPIDVLKKFYESEGFQVVDGKDNMVFEKQE